jgi:hypothetical protein
MIKRFLTSALMALALAFATGTAMAQSTWTWNLSGSDTGSGTFTTTGDGSSWTDITSWTGTFDGYAIGGLLSTGADTGNWSVDNQFKNDGSWFSNGGVLFSVLGLNVNGGSNVNLFTDGGNLISGTGTNAGGYHLGQASLSVTAVPEPASMPLMIAGIGALGLMFRQREKKRKHQPLC